MVDHIKELNLDGSVKVLDAGMGKTLAMRGVYIPNTIWSANALLEAPDVVQEIHSENIQAGADIITTNSYGIILSDLKKEGLADRFDELNLLAGEIAQEASIASERRVLVAGSLPPQNGSYRPDRVLDESLLIDLYNRQMHLLEPYIDFFLFETMSSINEARAALKAAYNFSKPVMIGLTLADFEPNRLRSGESLTDCIELLISFAPLGILANCCLPERITDAMTLLAGSGVPYVGGYGNAFSHVPKDWLLDGSKSTDGSLQMRNDLTPSLYADFALNWLDQGANIVGGCCGTTAQHVHSISSRLANFKT